MNKSLEKMNLEETLAFINNMDSNNKPDMLEVLTDFIIENKNDDFAKSMDKAKNEMPYFKELAKSDSLTALDERLVKDKCTFYKYCNLMLVRINKDVTTQKQIFDMMHIVAHQEKKFLQGGVTYWDEIILGHSQAYWRRGLLNNLRMHMQERFPDIPQYIYACNFECYDDGTWK